MNDELERLEKVDLVQQRTGLDFRTSRSLLEESDWDLLEALTLYETSKAVDGCTLVERFKKVVNRGNNTKIVVKSKEDTVMKLPVTAGIVGAIFAPKLALLGAAGCLLSKCSLTLQKPQDTTAQEDAGLIDN